MASARLSIRTKIGACSSGIPLPPSLQPLLPRLVGRRVELVVRVPVVGDRRAGLAETHHKAYLELRISGHGSSALSGYGVAV